MLSKPKIAATELHGKRNCSLFVPLSVQGPFTPKISLKWPLKYNLSVITIRPNLQLGLYQRGVDDKENTAKESYYLLLSNGVHSIVI